MSTAFFTAGTSLLLLSTIILKQAAADNQKPIVCGHCPKHALKAGECDDVMTCSLGEVCYAQVTEIAQFGLTEPEKHYYRGCTKVEKCVDVGNTILEPDGTWESQRPLCGGCCNSTECNKFLCGIHMPDLVTDNLENIQCAHCSKHALKSEECDGIMICSLGEVCYAQVTEIAQFGLEEPEKHYYRGCTKMEKCGDAGHTILEPDGTWEFQTPLCGGCCNSTECNKFLCGIHKPATTTSASATPEATMISKPTTTTASPAIKTTVQGTLSQTTTLARVDRCMKCVPEGFNWNCSHSQKCNNKEVCFIQELKISIPSLSKVYYHGGCTVSTLCANMNTTSVEDEHGLADVVQGECCYTDDCNRSILQAYKGLKTVTNSVTTTRAVTSTTTTTTTDMTALPTSTTPTTTFVTQTQTTTLARVDRCMKCVPEGFNWNCSHSQKCNDKEVCFIQELKISIPSLSKVYYHGGCTVSTMCANMNTTSVEDEHGLADVVQGECCYTNDCNRSILQAYKGTAANAD